MISVGDAVAAGRFVYENRKELSAFWRWFKKSRILIIGPGGVGKTTLARILAGEIDWLTSAPWQYSQSYNTEKLKLKSHLQVEMVVAPGQKTRRKMLWQAVQADLASGKYKGVILVSAYGHHSIPEGTLKTVRPGMTKDAAIESLLAEYRSDEIAVLKELSEFLKVAQKKIWMLSVVTKQDLWYSANDPSVRQQYTEGEYAHLIREIVAHRGVSQFRHELAFASLVIANYETQTNDILKKNLAGYDQRMQVESVQRVIAILDSLREWERQ